MTVFESQGSPGGRAGRASRDGFLFDTGPVVLTAPEIVEECFSALGLGSETYLKLKPVDPMYRACYADGSELRVWHDQDRMLAEVEAVCGAAEAAAFARYGTWLRELYALERPNFIDRNFDSVRDLARPLDAALKLVLMGGFSRMSRIVGERFADDRLRRLFSFQALYAGLSPSEALGVYCIIGFLDIFQGVFVPEGGMHELPCALAAAAADSGVRFAYDTPVDRVILQHGAAGPVKGLRLASGEHVPCDVVVCNADLPVAYRTLVPGLPQPRAVRRGSHSPSCALWLAGVRGHPPAGAAHHNIHFGREWDRAFEALRTDGTRMPDPSLLVSLPGIDDPSYAPDGCTSIYALEPVPNLDGQVDWTVERSRLRDDLERRLAGFGYPTDIVVEELIDPMDWERQGMERGTPFGLAHTFLQTGPFRPSNIAKAAPGLVFTGTSTVPGIGIPMVLLSGKLAAARVEAR